MSSGITTTKEFECEWCEFTRGSKRFVKTILKVAKDQLKTGELQAFYTYLYTKSPCLLILQRPCQLQVLYMSFAAQQAYCGDYMTKSRVAYCGMPILHVSSTWRC